MLTRTIVCTAAILGISSPALADINSRYTDSTGTITINIRICDATFPPAQHNQVSCGVPDGFVLTGGGAEVLADPNSATSGALITGSFPDSNASSPTACSVWTAISDDHHFKFPHELRAYSIGMQLKSRFNSIIPAATLQASMTCSKASATKPWRVNAPRSTCSTPSRRWSTPASV